MERFLSMTPLKWIKKVKLLFISSLLTVFSFAEGSIPTLYPEVVAKVPHSFYSFTQGLAFVEGELFESTGLYGHSKIEKLNPKTGAILLRAHLPHFFYAEGIACQNETLFLLTWKEGKCLLYDKKTLKKTGELAYKGEGWGLCSESQGLWMSNGSSSLTLRDPKTFKILKTLKVTLEGKPLERLNDLECVGKFIYANVWGKEWIAKIDKETGRVVSIIDCSMLLTDEERKLLDKEMTLNGIAYDPHSKTFFLTGKRWKWLFRVRLST